MRLFEFVRRPKVQFEKAIYFPGYPVKCEEYDPFNKENAIRTDKEITHAGMIDDYYGRRVSFDETTCVWALIDNAKQQIRLSADSHYTPDGRLFHPDIKPISQLYKKRFKSYSIIEKKG